MKANELMIGDWVMYRNTPRKVALIYCRPLPDGSTPANEIGFTYDEDEWINSDHASPIPITEEILEGIGFEYGSSEARRRFEKIIFNDENRHIGDEKWHTRCDELVLEKRIERDKYGEYIIWDIEGFTGIIYVHELQHALRLLELSEIADNFKMEGEK